MLRITCYPLSARIYAEIDFSVITKVRQTEGKSANEVQLIK